VGFVDVHVANPFPANTSPPQIARIAIANDINGINAYDYGQLQLIGSIQAVSASLPSGSVSTNVFTYR